jgi:hypothetical protein
VVKGQGLDTARRRGAVGVGDQRAQGLVPTLEVREDGLLRRLGVGEVDAVGPVLSRGERGVDVEAAVGFAMGEEALVVAETDEETPADQGGARRVVGVGLQQVGSTKEMPV